MVTVTRLAYRRKGHANLHPADTALHAPVERHSHGRRRLAAVEAARGSFEEVWESIQRTTGECLGKRQIEAMAERAADFDAFYTERRRPSGDPDDTLVLTCDGKRIVMRPEALRAVTAEASDQAVHKRQARLSSAEKRNRKRMAVARLPGAFGPAVCGLDVAMVGDRLSRDGCTQVWADGGCLDGQLGATG